MSVPLIRLASLDLIRGYVAVGRRMSITLAADDLCLTQSAVSRQVRSLEELLGVKLLVRGHRSITFTPEGERLFRVADAAVQQLQDVVGSIRVSSVRHPVTITCAIGVAGLWVLPRLTAFQHQHPDIDVRLSANNKIGDLRNDEVDLAIRYCAEDAAPEGAIRLFGESVLPVAHPSLGLTKLASASDLKNLVLLEFDGEYRPWLSWDDWLECQGWAGAKPKGVLRFNQYDQMIRAAEAGQGIALGRLELLDLSLRDGLLTTLATPKPGPSTSYGYWLLSAEAEPRGDVQAVADWIRAEALALSHPTAREPQ